MAHVGDRDDQPKTRRVRLGVHRIVKIARILPVDGDERQRTQVDARVRLTRIHLLAASLRLAQRRSGKFVRQIKARDRGFRGHLHRTIRIQALCDHGLSGRARARVPGDPGNDPVTVTRAVQLLRRHCAAQLQPPVGGDHPGAAPLDLHGAEKRGDSALEHLLDDPGPALARVARHLHPQPIAVHHAAHLRRRQEHAFPEALDAQEAEARAIRAHRALDDGARPYAR